MNDELHKLRIEKHHKAARGDRPLWPWILAIILLAGAGAGFWQWQEAGAAIAVETIRVRIPEGAARDDDLVVLSATGYVMAAHRIELASKVIGRVAWVGVEMGDKVKEGQILVRLEDDEYRARSTQAQGQLDNAKARLAEFKAGSRPEEIAQAQADLQSATVDLDSAQRTLDRLRAIKTTVSRQELDDAETLVDARHARVESLRQQLGLIKAGPRQEQIDAQQATVGQFEGVVAMAKVDLDNTIIRAPIASTILERNVEVGEFVTNGFVGDRGAKGYVVALADLNDLRVELDISQNDFARVSSDQPCWIVTDAYPDRKYEGVVDLISPVANRQKATILVRVRVKNPDPLLKPDMNATVSFLSPQKLAAAGDPASRPAPDHAAIRIPATAVHEGAVFVAEEGHAVRRGITIGLNTAAGEVTVQKGLIGGEDLIISSDKPLRDGDRITLAHPAK